MLSLNRDIPWFERGLGELGVAELPGAEHNPRILEYHAVTGGWSRDEVPWCGSFTAWCMDPYYVPPERAALARSWIRFGEPSDERLGAVCVIKRRQSGADRRTGSRGGYHVGFFVNRSRAGLVLLSGNSQNRVGVDWYSNRRYEIKALRWPE